MKTLQKQDYNTYTKSLEELGWRRTYKVITENDTELVTVKSGKIGNTSLIVVVKCPDDKKISIKGTQKDKAIGNESKYTLRTKFANKSNTEIHKLALIRITNEPVMSGIDQVARIFYADISDERTRYKFKNDIEIDSGRFLSIYVVGESPTNGPFIPDVNIDASHVEFSLGCDIWSRQWLYIITLGKDKEQNNNLKKKL